MFISDCVITDKQQAEHVQLGLMELFPECDKACKNADRLFFGGKSILHKDETALMSSDNISELESFGAFCTLPYPAVTVLSFYKECCCERKIAVDNCTCAIMYEVFKAWCKDNSNYTPKKSEFRQELADTLSFGDISKLIKTVNGTRYYTFTITKEAKSTYAYVYGFDTVQ